MTRISAFILLCITTLSSAAQDAHLSPLKKHDVLVGFGFGSKSHFGNWGITSNFLVTDKLNAKISIGGGQFNYNGFILSVGPEYCLPLSERYYLMLGTVGTLASGVYDVINDDEPDRREYRTYRMKYIRSYTGIAYNLNGALLKVEVGYSYALRNPTFTLYHTWTPAHADKVKKGMDSGILVSVCLQGIFHVGKKVY